MKFSADKTAVDIEVVVVGCSTVARHALIICTYSLIMIGAIKNVETQQEFLEALIVYSFLDAA
jgi:hypothetical protein